ncbi:hypothetical protein F4808DRAFT_67031 [Astrocystis sublimbata]|nr:hypothetical protein F4808DRAFT_67031 [Astrocystis sublimbata]
MSSRFNAARPKRAGEAYARQHHNNASSSNNSNNNESGSKKVKFDVRNPSALAPSADDGDDDDADGARDVFLEADDDVIGKSAATKRGAVNIDGYDSDSDREELGAVRASKASKKEKEKAAAGEDEDMDDMFAEEDDDTAEAKADNGIDPKTGKKSKEVRFVATGDIDGQEEASKSGGHVRIDGMGGAEGSSDSEDEEEIAAAIAEEAVDEEIGAGGLKKHAPKIEAFNLKQENEEGRFDEAGNFVRRAVDPDAVHDRWLEGLSKKDMKRAAEAHEKREAELREKRRADDDMLASDLLKALITHLERGETALEALARLGRAQNKNKVKKVPRWKQQKKKAAAEKTDSMDVDTEEKGGKDTEKEKEKEKEPEDPEQTRVKESIDAITDAADKLLGRDRADIYDQERERLIRDFVRETDEEWVEPAREQVTQEPSHSDAVAAASKMWEYRWTDGRDGASKQGPFEGSMMKAWQDAGYFGEGVEFREVGDETWSRTADFV